MGLDHYIGANVKDDVIMWGDFEESVSIPASLYLTSKPLFR